MLIKSGAIVLVVIVEVSIHTLNSHFRLVKFFHDVLRHSFGKGRAKDMGDLVNLDGNVQGYSRLLLGIFHSISCAFG